MKKAVVPGNTRVSNMDEPPWFPPDAKGPDKLSPEENARRDALLKEIDEIYPEKGKEKSKPDSR